MSVEAPQRQELLGRGNFQEVRDANGNLTGYQLVDNGQVLQTIQTSIGPQYVGPETVSNPFAQGGKYEMNWGENNAMQTILGRGRKADGSWDIGWAQGLMGNNITQQQMDDFQTLQTYQPLASAYNQRLSEAGLNPVSFGETEASVTRRLTQAENLPETRRLEAQRVEGLMDSALQLQNQGRRLDNTEATTIQQTEQARDDAKTEGERTRAFELGMQELRNDAENRRYEQELERYDRQDRKDNIAALIAGLATLGAGFAM